MGLKPRPASLAVESDNFDAVTADRHTASPNATWRAMNCAGLRLAASDIKALVAIVHC